MTKINGIHIYQGDCPDKVNGPYSRDKNCPVCKILMELEELNIAVKHTRDKCASCGNEVIFDKIWHHSYVDYRHIPRPMNYEEKYGVWIKINIDCLF